VAAPLTRRFVVVKLFAPVRETFGRYKPFSGKSYVQTFVSPFDNGQITATALVFMQVNRGFGDRTQTAARSCFREPSHGHFVTWPTASVEHSQTFTEIGYLPAQFVSPEAVAANRSLGGPIITPSRWTRKMLSGNRFIDDRDIRAKHASNHDSGLRSQYCRTATTLKPQPTGAAGIELGPPTTRRVAATPTMLRRPLSRPRNQATRVPLSRNG
jgi:hypothetical protein